MSRMQECRLDESGHQPVWTPAQRAAILDEMNSVLDYPSFKSSKRCVSLLRRLVEHALNGELEGIKERTLGVEVFGRALDYDTGADPIVRMSANEIRKRLAQFYQEHADHRAVRIRLVPGAYSPQFDFDAAEVESATDEMEKPRTIPAPISVLAAPEPDMAKGEKVLGWRRARTLSLSGAFLAVLAMLAFYFASSARSTQSLVWAPLVNSNEPVTVCVFDFNANGSGDPQWAQTIYKEIHNREFPPETEPQIQNPPQRPVVTYVDAAVAGRISSWLLSHRKQADIQRGSVLTLADLRRGPVVLIGAFDNPWTLILLSNLRYRVQLDPVTEDEWIEDAQAPAKRDWKGTGKLQYADSSVDYAIVTRILDADTGKWILAVGGLGMHGTEAAAELLTDRELAKSLPASLRSAKNFQVVLKTSVISGNTGPPQILAVYTW